jgi:regulator of protease activity HflC (stomatin/prohibitin superfamily)
MKYVLAAVAAIIGLAWLFFAGQRVEVPPGHVAKIFGKNGYQEQVIPTSKFRLEPCITYCDEIVYMPVNEFTVTEDLELFMPVDKLVVKVKIRAVILPNPAQYDVFFARVTPQGNKIDTSIAYRNMVAMMVQTTSRELLSKYTIAQIVSSLNTINQELSQKLGQEIATKSPFQAKSVGLADVVYPEIIIKAQENAAERREAIQSEEAQLEVSKVRLERTLQETAMQRKIDVAKAQAEAERNRIIADSITPAYIRFRQLDALDKIAESDNTKFVPIEMLSSMSTQLMLAQPTGGK